MRFYIVHRQHLTHYICWSCIQMQTPDSPSISRVFKVKPAKLFLLFLVGLVFFLEKRWREIAELQMNIWEMTACSILEIAFRCRKFVLISTYSSVCFLFLWLPLLTPVLPALPYRHLALVTGFVSPIPFSLFLVNSQFLFLGDFCFPFLFTASCPSWSDFSPSMSPWLGFM